MSVAVYPGSFDPITYGHLDVVSRSAAVFDRLVIAVLVNRKKMASAPVDDRVAAIRTAVEEVCPDLADRVEIESFDGLTVEFCRDRGAGFIVPVSGDIKLMPGTASQPAFMNIDVDVKTGRVVSST